MHLFDRIEIIKTNEVNCPNNNHAVVHKIEKSSILLDILIRVHHRDCRIKFVLIQELNKFLTKDVSHETVLS